MKYLSLFFLFFCVTLFVRAAVYVPTNYVWTSPSRNSSESMPCGGGDMGMNIWVEQGDIFFYVTRSGSFDENNTLLKSGRFRIRFSPNPFINVKDFRQVLHLNDGSVEISASGTIVRIWADVFHPVAYVDVVGKKPLKMELSYESWRYRDRLVTKGESQQCSYKWALPKGTVTHCDSILATQTGLTFFHHNNSTTVFDYTVHQQGLDSVKETLYNPIGNLVFGGQIKSENLKYQGTSFGNYAGTDYKAWTYTSACMERHQSFAIAFYTSQGNSDAWKKSLAKIEINRGKSHKQSSRWWKLFWQRSFIESDQETSEITRNYTLFRYMMGCNSHSTWPTKFNGGLFTFDPVYVDSSQAFTPDYRRWGGGTMTAQNQRLLYWPLLKSGDYDLMQSQFDSYLRMLPTAIIRSKIYWGHDGACFTEQIENYGLPNPAEYGTKHPKWFDKGLEYNAWLEYEWDTVLEFCQMILQSHSYADIDISKYESLISESLHFFDNHYRYLASHRGRKELDGDGKLILFPASGCETYKMATDPASTIAALQTVLHTWGKDSTMLARIPQIPLHVVSGDTLIAPARTWERINNVETPQLYPVFPWRIYGVGRENLDIARNTYLYDRDAVKNRSYIGWKQDNIWAACLGLTDEASKLIKLKLHNGPWRFPAFWGPGYDWAPDHNWGGSGMIGLQEMLMQEANGKIFLFPAWPKSWNVHFKMHASKNTTVEAELKNGKVVLLKVDPQTRVNDVVW